jgi:hypothetical protein
MLRRRSVSECLATRNTRNLGTKEQEDACVYVCESKKVKWKMKTRRKKKKRRRRKRKRNDGNWAYAATAKREKKRQKMQQGKEADLLYPLQL